MINWICNEGDMMNCHAIAKKFCDLTNHPDMLTVAMDVQACHCNGNPLRLEELLNADNGNFVHDVSGIISHINRDTGKLEDFFSPKFSKIQSFPEENNVFIRNGL